MLDTPTAVGFVSTTDAARARAFYGDLLGLTLIDDGFALVADLSGAQLHIADPTGEAIHAAGLRKVALLGTMPVMRSRELVERYRARYGVELLVPDDDDAALVDGIIFDELVRRELRAASKQTYLSTIAKLRAAGAEGVILGCTEIFLLVDQDDLPGFPVFDTAALHIAAAVRFAFWRLIAYYRSK